MKIYYVCKHITYICDKISKGIDIHCKTKKYVNNSIVRTLPYINIIAKEGCMNNNK